ncbi:MAG: 2-oxo acid dehydrogenase subunit E2 [Candidatus Marinimicrobia bacterium]|nr:2-oxo acid dehydrogenase subunit E2 [Candidatus Neomarinimicrobiota bacterium]
MNEKQNYISPWRLLAISAYKAPSDSKIYGTFEVDVTDVLNYIEKAKGKGKKLTITHFVIAALARTLHEDVPEINCYITRGKFKFRKNVNICISVSIDEGTEMTAVIIKKANELSVSEICDKLNEEVEKIRLKGEELEGFDAKKFLSKIPWPFRTWFVKLIKFWVYDLGLKFPFLNIPSDPFGSLILSNIGSLGLTVGLGALFPLGRVPAVIMIGKIQDKPVVINGEIKIRSILPFGGTFDHRIVDGAQISKFVLGAVHRLQKPEQLDKPNRKE